VRCWVKSRNERNPRPMLPASLRARDEGIKKEGEVD